MALGRVAVAVLSLLTFLLALTVQGILKVLLIGRRQVEQCLVKLTAARDDLVL